ncbi:hypothetical protein IFM89_025387 [Coptis chinensis]|uniref:Uncharacterized protein n=1 Tax=Coptis chinensis TaxID=261450 RepID=A0A835HS28_9MAGN|nr:hypothetical protein IFM89_025387 [Coptis chinensis]
MEKPQEQNKKDQQHVKALVWDCDSSLYDSFELKSFERQLDSAISRTQSMPHVSASRHAPLPQLPLPPQPFSPKKSSKFSRSIHKLFRSIIRPKPNSSMIYQVEEWSKEGVYFVYDRSGALSTIPEASEHGMECMGHSTEFDSIVRKTASERFTATSIGISCA